LVNTTQLLNREPVKLDTELISNTINGKTVLITGAGGSIGSEICRQIFLFGPKKMVLIGHGENSIYEIENELLENDYERTIEIVSYVADIKDEEQITKIFEIHKPSIVYHAAAHKHVPLMEKSPLEAIKNNIFGTLNVASASVFNNVETFVMVSTDKAVNPTNVMGATKRAAELVIQAYNDTVITKFVAVRFGNVLGSRGSVVPKFEKQIERGLPLTITHPEMTRYFMTIPEASSLVLQASALANGGEIFVLDMGQPVKIVSLATKLIELKGLDPYDYPINYTGIRPGEKMYEELHTSEEELDTTSHHKIFVTKREKESKRENYLAELVFFKARIFSPNTTEESAKHLLSELVPSYSPKKLEETI